MIVGPYIQNKNFNKTENLNSDDKRKVNKKIVFINHSKGYKACEKDIKNMSFKLSRLLSVYKDWTDEDSPNITKTLHKALEESIKKTEDDMDFSLRTYHINDKKEQSDLTKEISELINKSKSIINKEDM